MKKRSHFWGNFDDQTFPSLTGNHHTDFLIIGGGITGLAAAYFLSQRTRARITLIERHTIGSGATGHSAGMLVSEPEHADWTTYVTHLGPRLARSYATAQRQALKTIRTLATLTGHEIEMSDLLLLGTSPQASYTLHYEAHVRKKIDLPTTTLTKAMRARELHTPRVTHMVRAGSHASTNPLGFARAIADYLASRGVTIFEKTTSEDIRRNRATTATGTITFSHAIEAQGIFTARKDITAYLTTIAVTNQLSKDELALIHLDDRDMFIDDETRSFHYGKLTSDNRLLVGYGDVVLENPTYKKALHAPHLRNIRRFLKKFFPNLNCQIEHAWSAPYALSKKLLPLISTRGKRTIINGGGTQLASIVAADYAVATILKKKHPLETLFKSTRS